MRSKIILCLKTAWLVTALIILLTGTNTCVSTDEACFAAGETMFLFMFLLSFPFGVVFLFLSMIFLESGSVHYPSDYISAWFIMACGGCCQWFVVVPRLFAKPTLTVIDLRQRQRPSGAISQPANVRSPSLIGSSQSCNLPPLDTAATRIRAHKARDPIVPFDRRGRTPLERVINRL